ncbi:MAG: thermonuclease family protein [Fervidobacterium sp.]|uniref:thermonuclease family protein n=1 Tax=Fervidobacterium sp. TaxID=1871331 RepID=UPI00404B045F
MEITLEAIRGWVALFLLALLSWILDVNDSNSLNSFLPSELTEATVTNVVDGSTLDVLIGDKTVRIGLIGVNTPNTDTKEGKITKNFVQEELLNKKVYLEYDKEKQDIYRNDKILAYVWLEKPTPPKSELEPHAKRQHIDNEIRTKMFNAKLILEGWARVGGDSPNVKYKEYFEKYQKEDKWFVDFSVDKITGHVSFFVISPSVSSSEPIEFPYKNMKCCVIVQAKEEGGYSAGLGLLADFVPYLESVSGLTRIRVKWDDELGKLTVYQKIDYPDVIIFLEVEEFIQRLKTHKKLLIELPFNRIGNVYYEFDLKSARSALAQIGL